MARLVEKISALTFLPNEWRKCQDAQSAMSVKWEIGSWSVNETEIDDDDDPVFKPLSVKHVRVKKCSPVRNSDLIGPKSATRRNDGKTDVILKFDGQTYQAHRPVLQGASELFEKEPSFQPSETESGTKRSKLAEEFDLTPILPEDSKRFDTVNKVINFAYTGRLPLATDVGFKHFFFTVVALQFSKALEIYDLYFTTLYKTKERMLQPSASAIILTECQKIRKPRQLSSCAEYLGNISESTTKYLLKEPLENLYDDAGFLAYMSVDALAAFLDRDDLAKPEDETKVFDLAINWLKFDHEDFENRQKYTKKILKKVHLGLVQQDRLIDLLPDLNEFPECKKWAKEVLRLLDSKDEVTVPVSMSHPQWFSPRNEMVVNALIGIGPHAMYGGQRLVYFNEYGPEKSCGWQPWCGFKDIPHDIPVYDPSALAINGKLFVAGGICKPGKRQFQFLPRPGYVYKWNSWCFHEGNVAEDTMKISEDGDFATIEITSPWTTLPELETVRSSFPMVYLDEYVYAIGGEDKDYNAIKEAERYSFKDKKWEKIANLPVPCYYACATVYKGKILVYGSQAVPGSDIPIQHNLQMYDPATKQWTNILTEHHMVEKFKRIRDDENANFKPETHIEEEDYGDHALTVDQMDDAKNRERGRLLPRNAIIVDGEECFRVVYPRTGSSGEKDPPLVHKLEFDFNSAMPTCNVGESVEQALMPTTGEGAFQLRNNVYVNMRGAVFKTNIKILPGQKTEVDLDVWSKLHHGKDTDYLKDLTFTTFTFDKKKVFCKHCVRGKHCLNHFTIFDDSDTLMSMMESDEDSD